MKTLDIFGPYTGPTGYDQMVRGFVSSLLDLGVRIRLKNFENWSAFNYFKNPLFDQLEQPIGTAKAMLSFCLPPQAIYNQSQYNIVFSMFEASKIGPQWQQAATTMDAVIVPCKSSEKAFIDGGVRPSAIRKVPLGVDAKLFNPDVEPMQFIDDEFNSLAKRYSIRVMNVQELGPRKNIEGIMRAWVLGTISGPMKDNACLTLKLSAYSAGRYHKLLGILNQIRNEYGINKYGHAPIFVNCKLFKHEEMPAYMAHATHYLSMSRGEGWDLPALQAAALGKILIVPQHSSYLDWAIDNRVKLLNAGKEIAAFAEGPLQDVYRDAKWFEPSVLEAAAVIETLPNTMFTDMLAAKDFGAQIRRDYDWKNVGAKLYDVIDRLVWSHETGSPNVDVSDQYQGRMNKDVVPVIAQWTQNLGKPCGIANYTSALCSGMAKVYPHIVAVGGDIRGHDMMCAVNSYKIENIQLEYQFAHPHRLGYMLQFLKERGVKSVVTMHTFNTDAHAHNRMIFKYADGVIVHSDVVKHKIADEWYPTDKIKVMPMPIPPLMSEEEKLSVPMLKVKKTGFLVAFYGFLYFHKGAEKLVRAFAEMKRNGHQDSMLLLVASKPQNTIDDVAGRVKAAIDECGLIGGRDYIWASDYVQNEREVIATLSQADLIVLPYDDYGSFGASAAIGSCIAAGRPVAVSNACWFSHVPEGVAFRLDMNHLADSLSVLVSDLKSKEVRESAMLRVQKFANENNIDLVAKKHLEYYSQLSGYNFIG